MAAAQDGIAAEPGTDSAVDGWDGLADLVRELPGRMLAKLPKGMRGDPQVRQEVGRLALAAITSMSIDALGGDGDHPVFLPTIGQLLNVGQPNADTIYRMSRITPGGSYRIRGLRGTLPIVMVGQSGPSPFEPGWTPEKGHRPHHDFNTLRTDAEGRYDVLLSPERPQDYAGDWWQLQPGTSKLMLRMVSADWAGERSPTFAIERVDRPVESPRPSADVLRARLEQLPGAIGFIAALFVGHVEKLRAEGYVNALKVLDVSQTGGLAGQSYYEGTYEIADDEALIVSTPVPARCTYHSLILTNGIYETIDWINNHSSLNDAQARTDADGVLRVVISSEDPGVPNWLDTAGHAQGLIQGRWVGCESAPIPTIRRLPLREVRAALPPETPSISAEARDRTLRDRRAAYQQRPQW